MDIYGYICIHIHSFTVNSQNDPKKTSNEFFRSNDGGVAVNAAGNDAGDGADVIDVDKGDSDAGIGIALIVRGADKPLVAEDEFVAEEDTDAAGKCMEDTSGNVFPHGTVGICGTDGLTGCGIICCIIWSNINGDVDSWNEFELW